jgi:hypothetical protein
LELILKFNSILREIDVIASGTGLSFREGKGSTFGGDFDEDFS